MNNYKSWVKRRNLNPMKEGDGTKQDEASIVHKIQQNRTNTEKRIKRRIGLWAVKRLSHFPPFYFFYLPSPLSNSIFTESQNPSFFKLQLFHSQIFTNAFFSNFLHINFFLMLYYCIHYKC